MLQVVQLNMRWISSLFHHDVPVLTIWSIGRTVIELNWNNLSIVRPAQSGLEEKEGLPSICIDVELMCAQGRKNGTMHPAILHRQYYILGWAVLKHVKWWSGRSQEERPILFAKDTQNLTKSKVLWKLAIQFSVKVEKSKHVAGRSAFQ